MVVVATRKTPRSTSSSSTTITNTTTADYEKHPVTYAFMFLQVDRTKEQYAKRLKLFFNFHQFPGNNLDEQRRYFLERARNDAQWATMLIMQFLVHHRERERVDAGKFASGSLKQYWQAIRKFTDAFMELRTVIDWKRIIESMPRAENYADDRIPTIEEIRKLVEHHDPRIKSIVYTMCSCGMRVGSWEFLKLKHITPITKAEHLQWKRQKEIDENPDHASKIVIIPADDDTKIVACKVILHGEKKRKRRNNDYVSFISPETWHAIQKWLEFRKRYGEQITGESYIMRHLFPGAHKKRADDSVAAAVASAASAVNDNDNDYIKITVAPRGRGLDRDAAHPAKMPRDSISSLLSDALYEQGLRETLEQGKTRHEFKSAHFTRKFFKTRAQQYMNSLNVEKLMDHRIGLDPNYWRPIEQELLADYLKAVPALTINDTDVTSLKEQQEQLEHRYQDKEKEIEEIRAQQTILQANMTNVLKFLAGMEKEVKIQAWDVSDGPFQTATKIIEEKRERKREKQQQSSSKCCYSIPVN